MNIKVDEDEGKVVVEIEKRDGVGRIQMNGVTYAKGSKGDVLTIEVDRASKSMVTSTKWEGDKTAEGQLITSPTEPGPDGPEHGGFAPSGSNGVK